VATPVSIPNPIKELFKQDKVALGMNVRLARSGDIAGIAKTTGHDFIFIDGQHALYNVETIGAIAMVANGIGVAPLARVSSCDDPTVQVLLDNGVMGIVFPDISTADQARRAVARSKFPPVGTRSVAGAYTIMNYRAAPQGELVAALQDNTLVVCMIETPEGLANVDAIAAVEGVDVIHIGLNDLLTAMGKPGSYGSAAQTAAVDKVIAACKKHGKVPGVGGDRNLARQVELIRKGMRFITTNSEIAFILAEGSRVTGELRKALEA
jgi:2-keto-3-deoxy-L-rhamnonate aldolase RhmA